MLIAEDLLLLLTDDVTGASVLAKSTIVVGLAGACLSELASSGRVRIAGPGEAVRPGRIVIHDATATGDDVLDEALRRVSSKEGKPPSRTLTALAHGLRPALLARFEARGTLRREKHRLLGIVAVERWPTVDPAPRQRCRALIANTLLDGVVPDTRTAGLIALLSAVDGTHRVLSTGSSGVDMRTLKKRALQLRKADWAAEAVASALARSAASGAVIVT